MYDHELPKVIVGVWKLPYLCLKSWTTRKKKCHQPGSKNGLANLCLTHVQKKVLHIYLSLNDVCASIQCNRFIVKIGLHHLFLYLSQTQLCMSFFALTANGIFPFSLPLFKAQVGHRPYPMKSRTLSLSTGKYCCTHYWTTIPSFCSTCWFKKHMLTTIVLILRQYFMSILMPKMEFTVNFFTNCKHSSWNSSSLHWIFFISNCSFSYNGVFMYFL